MPWPISSLPPNDHWHSSARLALPALRPLPAHWIIGLLVALTLPGCRPQIFDVIQARTFFRQQTVTLYLATRDGDLAKVAGTLAIAEIKRLEAAYDPLNSDGVLYRLNEQRRTGDPELLQLLQRGREVSLLTRGRYNLFMAYPEKAYGFGNLYPEPPSLELLRETMLPIRRAEITLGPTGTDLSLPDDAYAVSLTGLIDGYVADQALAHLKLAGVGQAMVQLGNYAAFGLSPDGMGWPLVIRHPETDSLVAQLFLESRAAATVSVAEQAFVYRGETYYNNLDPITGLPARWVLSVTVVAPTSEQAGTLAKGIFTMAPTEGLLLLNELTEVDGLLIDLQGKVWRSDSLTAWLVEG